MWMWSKLKERNYSPMSGTSQGVFLAHLTPDILAAAAWAWKAFFLFNVCFWSPPPPPFPLLLPGTWQRWCLLLCSFPSAAATKEREKGKGGYVGFKSWTLVLGQTPFLCIRSHFNRGANLDFSGKQSFNTVHSREALCLYKLKVPMIDELKLFRQCS